MALFVFPFTATAVRLAFERVRSRAGVPDLRFHDLRREGITRFIEFGLNLIEASAISGHRDLRMLKRYVVPSPSALLAKLDRAETGPERPNICPLHGPRTSKTIGTCWDDNQAFCFF